MTFVVWAGTFFGQCLWQLLARLRSLAGPIQSPFGYGTLHVNFDAKQELIQL